MRERYQMLISSPLWLPVFLLTMLVVAVVNPEDFKTALKEAAEIVKFGWRN